MSFKKFDQVRRSFLTRGASLFGATLGGTVLASSAGCDNKAKPVGATGAAGRYVKYNDKLSHMFSAIFQDIMDGMGKEFHNQCMDPKIRPLLPSMRTWGEAVTIRMEAVNEVPKEPFQLEMELIDDLYTGQMVIAQCNAPRLSAFWGGLLSNAAVGHNASGVICDGGVRDYDEIVELNFPVFSAGLTPYDSLGRMDGKERDITVVCGGVRVVPGDLVFGDVDGIVVIPQGIVDEIIPKAWEKVQGEDVVREELRGGASVVDTFKKYGIL